MSEEMNFIDENGNPMRFDEIFSDGNAWTGEEETCPKCGAPLIKDENGQCVECNRKPYFTIEVKEYAYEKIKSGERPFIRLPFEGSGNTGLVYSKMEQVKNGVFMISYRVLYEIVKIQKSDSKKWMAFTIYGSMLDPQAEYDMILLFLGKQVGIVGEEISDICEVDMEEKSKEFINNKLKQ